MDNELQARNRTHAAMPRDVTARSATSRDVACDLQRHTSYDTRTRVYNRSGGDASGRGSNFDADADVLCTEYSDEESLDVATLDGPCDSRDNDDVTNGEGGTGQCDE